VTSGRYNWADNVFVKTYQSDMTMEASRVVLYMIEMGLTVSTVMGGSGRALSRAKHLTHFIYGNLSVFNS